MNNVKAVFEALDQLKDIQEEVVVEAKATEEIKKEEIKEEDKK